MRLRDLHFVVLVFSRWGQGCSPGGTRRAPTIGTPWNAAADRDCAPADAVERRADGSYLVTSRGMSVVIPANYQAWRKSPDERIHVCIRKLRSGSEYLICAFRGPGA